MIFQPGYPSGKLAFACVFEFSLLVIAYTVGWFAGIDPLGTVARDGLAVVTGLVAVIPLSGLLWWGLSHPHGAVGRVTREAQDIVMQLLGGIGLGGFAIIAVLAGVCEEALFRGVIQAVASLHSNDWAGLIIASLFFGLAHAVSWAYAVIAAFMGAYLGLLYIYTGGIVAPVVCHGVYDFVALVWLVRSGQAQFPQS